MTDAIRLLPQNFTLSALVSGLAASAASLARRPRPWGPPVVVEAPLSYFIMFPIALGNFYNFVVHFFFGEKAARFIG